MGSTLIDMTGWVMSEHGIPDSRLTVIKRDTKNKCKGSTMWICKCSCGSSKDVISSGNNIRCGRVKSCGCLNKEKTIQRNKSGHETKYEELEDGYAIHPSNSDLVAYIDKDDYDVVKNYTWAIRKRDDKYCRYTSITTNINGRPVPLCRVITGYEYCDHIDRNPLNNHKSNLRRATHEENVRNCSKGRNNTSGFIGVVFDKKTGMWESQIGIYGKNKHLGKFEDKIDALKARLSAELKYFGKDFAPQRDLFQEYGII